jgi:hypothetical protein
VRLTRFCAGIAIAASLALSACSSNGGGSQGFAPSQSVTAPLGHMIDGPSLRPANKVGPYKCPKSQYLFCVTVKYGDSGPYVAFSCSVPPNSHCASEYYLTTVITNYKGESKGPTHHISQWWDPNPYTSGSGSSLQYISELTPIRHGSRVRFVDSITACPKPYGQGHCRTFVVGIFSND